MTRSFLGTFALVFAAMAGLFVFDTFLEKAEQSESHTEAQRLFREGDAFLRKGDARDAIERFRSALTLARNNPQYELALARALFASGQLNDAEQVVSGLLDRDPGSGDANLTMARILAKQGKFADADFYYHRAIYGKWPEDATRRSLEVRLELVDLLARQGDKQALLAELLPLEDAKLDLQTREHIANLYITAGSPNRAAQIFRQILHEQPSNPEAFAGLGTAEFAKGNYRTAHVDFLIASRLKPADAELKKQLNLSSEVLALDPTMRGLSSKERFKRSTQLLDLASQAVRKCLAPGVSQPLLDDADAALKRKVRPRDVSDATEANVDLAEKLWQLRKKQCKQGPTEDEQAMALVLAKIAQ